MDAKPEAQREAQTRPQSRPGAGARDRSRRARRVALDGPRQEERGGRRRRRGDAPRFDTHRHHRHRGDRRGRDGRGADALYRREGRRTAARRWTSPSIRWRARRSPRRARRTRSPRWRWRRRAISCTRPTSTWTRSRSAAGCRRAWSISTRRSARICATSRGPRTRDVADLVVCILDRDRHAEI